MRLFTPIFLFATFLLSLPVAGQEIKSRSLGSADWDRAIAVETGEAKFGDDLHHAYTIKVYDATDSDITKYWKDYLKTRGAKVKTRGGVQAEGAVIEDVNGNPIEVLTSFSPGADNATLMHVALIKEGVAMNPDEHPEEHEKIMTYMRDLSVEMNRAVVTHQIGSQEETLADLQKDLENLQKEHEKMRDNITKNRKRIEDSRQDIGDAEAEIAGLKSQLEVYTTKESKTEDDMKSMEKIRKKITKLHDKKAKEEQRITDSEAEIQQAEAALPLNEEEQARLKERIEQQRGVVDQYREKKEKVN